MIEKDKNVQEIEIIDKLKLRSGEEGINGEEMRKLGRGNIEDMDEEINRKDIVVRKKNKEDEKESNEVIFGEGIDDGEVVGKLK